MVFGVKFPFFQDFSQLNFMYLSRDHPTCVVQFGEIKKVDQCSTFYMPIELVCIPQICGHIPVCCQPSGMMLSRNTNGTRPEILAPKLGLLCHQNVFFYLLVFKHFVLIFSFIFDPSYPHFH